MANEPELEQPVLDAAQPDTGVTTPEDLGGSMDEEGKFRADFDSVIDASFEKIKKPDLQPAKDVVAPAEDTAAKGATGAAEAPGQTGPTGPSGAAQTQQSGPTGPTGAAEANDRDKDLDELAGKLGDMSKRPKTREIIEGYKGKVTQERNQREAAQRKAQELEAQIEELKKAPMPKDVEAELKELRETVRELDAARDPSIKQKFDTKISSNEDTIISMLKEHGFGKTADGKEIPGAVEALKKSGVSRRTLHETITLLEKSGDGAAVEAAEHIKDLLRENGQLSKDREREVQSFKAGAEERTKTQQAEIAKQVEQANQRLQESVKEHTGKWEFLKEPPAPLPNDAPAVRAEKERARVAHNERINKYNEGVRSGTSTPVDTQISARVGILYRDVIAPQLQTQLDKTTQELATLREKMKAMMGAGDLSKKVNTNTVQRSAPKDDTGWKQGDSFEDFVDSAAKKAGLI